MGVERVTALRKVAVAILSWNGKHHLETCLEALAAQHDPGVDWEILVLDNGSTDGTVAWMREHWGQDRRVRLIESPVNLGFCTGNNRLVAATDADTDAVALLNNDTRPEPGWLGALVSALGSAPPDVAAVSGKIVDWAGERLDFGRGLMTFDGHAFQLDYRRPLKTARVPAAGAELAFACGGNMLIRRASFLAAGGFDEDYFAYLEDVDLGWRLWSGGERVVFAPEAAVHHRSGATSDLLGLYNRGFLFERNAYLTAYKNYEPGLWERILPAVMLTLASRTQTLLESNPGGEILRVDPYAGHIANTAGKVAAAVLPGVDLPPATTWEGFKVRWRGYGPWEFLRRGLGKLAGGPPPGASSPSSGPESPRLTDERTVAQLRATHWLLNHLDGAALRRAEIQKRRRRPDKEIFERFPVYLVPTYPGDHALFASAGFRDWLPKDLPLIEARLEEIMEMG
ncbi:MAG TPA: glycosyltransferase family 2 protein [Thermoanaerobaculia bacterium]|nr:glycosyltransferase family 2 protein [Thermoanaerobaculia bacterium]